MLPQMSIGPRLRNSALYLLFCVTLTIIQQARYNFHTHTHPHIYISHKVLRSKTRFWTLLHDSKVIYHLFILWPHLWHMEFPRLGADSELQPPAYATTTRIYTIAFGNARSLTHWERPGIKPATSGRQHQVLNPLSHNGNSQSHFLTTIDLATLHSGCTDYHKTPYIPYNFFF